MKLIFFLIALVAPCFAQTVSLRGQVTDESGGVVPAAVVTIAGPGGLSRSIAAGADGTYSFSDLPAGSYIVQASAPGLAMRRPAKLSLTSGVQTLNLLLNVAAAKQEVTVEETGRPTVSTDAAANASAVVLRGSDLDALS